MASRGKTTKSTAGGNSVPREADVLTASEAIVLFLLWVDLFEEKAPGGSRLGLGIADLQARTGLSATQIHNIIEALSARRPKIIGVRRDQAADGLSKRGNYRRYYFLEKTEILCSVAAARLLLLLNEQAGNTADRATLLAKASEREKAIGSAVSYEALERCLAISIRLRYAAQDPGIKSQVSVAQRFFEERAYLSQIAKRHENV
jgi:hypothetical protein